MRDCCETCAVGDDRLKCDLDIARACAREMSGQIDALEEAAKKACQILYDAPELNADNYDHDQVCDLSRGALDAYVALEEAVGCPKDWE